MRFISGFAMAWILSVGVGGCASSAVTPEQDEQEAAQTAFPDLKLPSLPKATPAIRGTPTEIYTRVARGAVTCWFGAHGNLKKTHVYHAVAKPPSKGGQARILIHKIDKTKRDKRGVRAFAIDIVPSGKTAKLEMQNALMGEPRGTEMASDVRRWARGIEGCARAPLNEGWNIEANNASGAQKNKLKRRTASQ